MRHNQPPKPEIIQLQSEAIFNRSQETSSTESQQHWEALLQQDEKLRMALMTREGAKAVNGDLRRYVEEPRLLPESTLEAIKDKRLVFGQLDTNQRGLPFSRPKSTTFFFAERQPNGDGSYQRLTYINLVHHGDHTSREDRMHPAVQTALELPGKLGRDQQLTIVDQSTAEKALHQITAERDEKIQNQRRAEFSKTWNEIEETIETIFNPVNNPVSPEKAQEKRNILDFVKKQLAIQAPKRLITREEIFNNLKQRDVVDQQLRLHLSEDTALVLVSIGQRIVYVYGVSEGTEKTISRRLQGVPDFERRTADQVTGWLADTHWIYESRNKYSAARVLKDRLGDYVRRAIFPPAKFPYMYTTFQQHTTQNTRYNQTAGSYNHSQQERTNTAQASKQAVELVEALTSLGLPIDRLPNRKDARDAYIKIMKRCHPDVRGYEFTQEAQKINLAYERLLGEIER